MHSSRSLTYTLRATRKLFLACITIGLLYPIAALAQSGDGVLSAAGTLAPNSWVRAFGTSGNGSNIAQAIKAGPDSSLYVTGRFSSTANFGGKTFTAIGPFNFFLAKYSESGTLLWIAQTVQAGSGPHNAGNGIDVDSAGNVYVTGSFFGNATFYSANPSDKKVTAASGPQEAIFLAKYSSSGTLSWVQTGTSNCQEPACPIVGYSVAASSVNNIVYVAGVTQANTTFSSANGSDHVISGTGLWQGYVTKYDTNGNFQWAETASASPNCAGYAVAMDSQGSAYTAGWLEDQTTFSSADGHDITITGFSPAQTDTNYPNDIYLAKYDKNGNAKWVNHIGGYKAVPSAVEVGPSGVISLVGFIGNISYGTPGEAKTIVSSQNGKNINLGGGTFTDPFNTDELVVTYNWSGNAVVAVRRGGAGNESATGLVYDSQKNLYVVALAQTSGQPHLFVDKYSWSNLQWEATATAGIYTGQIFLTPAVTVDAAGSVFVAGGYEGTATFGNLKLAGGGISQVFVAGLNTAFASH